MKIVCNFFQTEKNKKSTLVIGGEIGRFRRGINRPPRASLLKRDTPFLAAEGARGEGVRREACFVLRQEGSKKIYAEKQKSYWTSLLKRGILPVYLSVIMYIVQ